MTMFEERIEEVKSLNGSLQSELGSQDLQSDVQTLEDLLDEEK
jgi:hypothetical protein